MQSNNYTNYIELYRRLNLDPARHALFLLEHSDIFEINQLAPFETVFFLSREGNTQKYYNPNQSNWHYFDSIVSDHYLVNPWMWHFFRTISVNTDLGLMDHQDPTTVKSLVWDALLGLSRRCRDRAHQRITKTPILRDQTFLTYYGTNKDFIPGYCNQMDPITIRWSSQNIEVDGIEWISHSQIMPTNIYNQTWFSLVCETMSEPQGWSFFTEKIAKPMLAGRPFVVLANRHYLLRLRSLGFQTFETVFDENYDNIEDHETRWDRALDLMEWITRQDPAKIYQSCHKAVLHNQQLIKTDWDNVLTAQIQKILSKNNTI